MSTVNGSVRVLLACVAAMAPLLSGCAVFVIGERYVLDEHLAADRVKMIRDGQTTRKEILDWFGPPAAAARQGTIVKIPRPGPIKQGEEEVEVEGHLPGSSGDMFLSDVVFGFADPVRHGSDSVSSETIFGRFPGAPVSAADHIVYYYADTAFTWSDVCIVVEHGGGCFPSSPLLHVRSLWVLIDERNGRVVHHRVEESERKVRGSNAGPRSGIYERNVTKSQDRTAGEDSRHGTGEEMPW